MILHILLHIMHLIILGSWGKELIKMLRRKALLKNVVTTFKLKNRKENTYSDLMRRTSKAAL